MFDVEELNNIDINNISDPSVYAAITKSKISAIESRGADAMNDLEQEMPVTSLIDEDLVMKARKYELHASRTVEYKRSTR